MTWLAGQLWPLLLLSAVLGAACVALWGQRRVTVEEWAEVPVAPAPEPAPAAEPTGAAEETEPAEDTTPASVTAPVPVDADDPTSPFPVAAGDPAPWEAEELWSRPARVGAAGQARRPKDEWTEAAENWRSWADEATGRGFSGVGLEGEALDPTDRDLFAADREPANAPGEASDDGDPFPYARPVEAPSWAEGTMDPMQPMDVVDPTADAPADALDDDEREAAEIRRMREQQRRGDAE